MVFVHFHATLKSGEQVASQYKEARTVLGPFPPGFSTLGFFPAGLFPVRFFSPQGIFPARSLPLLFFFFLANIFLSIFSNKEINQT